MMNISKGIIQYCLKSKAKIAIIAMQDILRLDDSARINLPGSQKVENWSWEMIDFNGFRKKVTILKETKELTKKK